VFIIPPFQLDLFGIGGIMQFMVVLLVVASDALKIFLSKKVRKYLLWVLNS